MKTVTFFILSLVSSLVTSMYAQKSFDVTIKGKGEPVFLFPGFGCTGELWNDTVSELSKTHECHIFTFAGFGDVDPIEMPWFSTIKEEIITYTKSNKINKPTLIGHSLGGTLSYWLTASEPNLFKKVIAVDALPCSAALMIPNYNGEKISYDNPQSKMMLQMDEIAFKGMNAQQVQFMCKNQEKQKVIIEMMNKADRKTYVNGYIDMLNLDLREEISKIKVPVIILAATFPDKATVEKTYQAQFEKLPSVKISYAENAAHFVMYDQPEWFMKNLIENLK
ncbi:MAG TPA: alpha/beta hydrolase [Flavobacterium sp.]|uniref:alpha/beta fold hydrolase n=1 Tax=unclassified Flavobacterium TaxID=196869 RepID=UPI000E9DBC2D|nr:MULTISPECIES: alpha/beta hydrolase [unclassified Flavobacterium]HBI01849.1 alpha/beta hydrolase [Flavobacterium sp.]HRE79023.1 alpha/beta hydrolase [Flavobacterium sp.]